MKLIASDFDCTLAFSNVIPEENIEAIRRFREAGNLFVIVTGRPYLFASEIITKVKAPCDALIACNGGMFLDEQARVTYKVMTSPDVLPPLIEMLYRYQPTLLVYSQGGEKLEYSEENGELFIEPPKENYRIREFFRTPRAFVQICVCFPTCEQAREITDVVNRAFYGKLDAKFNGGNCDITAFGVQKPIGIQRFVETLGKMPDEIITVGDNNNDLSMLEAYHGFAVENAGPEVLKTVEGRVVKSVADLINRKL